MADVCFDVSFAVWAHVCDFTLYLHSAQWLLFIISDLEWTEKNEHSKQKFLNFPFRWHSNGHSNGHQSQGQQVRQNVRPAQVQPPAPTSSPARPQAHSGNQSPTMPALVEYKPFTPVRTNNGSATSGNMYLNVSQFHSCINVTCLQQQQQWNANTNQSLAVAREKKP